MGHYQQTIFSHTFQSDGIYSYAVKGIYLQKKQASLLAL
jgi:hypothetical protein